MFTFSFLVFFLFTLFFDFCTVSPCFRFLSLSYIYFSECDNTLIRAGTVWQQCTSTISGYSDQGVEEQRCHLNTPCELGIASHSNISNKTMTKTCYADCNFQQQASADGTDISVEDSCPAQFPYEKTKTCQEYWTSSENQYNNGLCYVANKRVLCPGIDESPALLATKKTQQYEFCKSYDNSQCVTNSTTEKKENVGCATGGNSSNTTTGATVQSPSPSPISSTTGGNSSNTTTGSTPTSSTTSDPVTDRATSTTMIKTEIAFDGMSAAEFNTNKNEITTVIATLLDVHPSMILVTVKSRRRQLDVEKRRRRLTADGDEVTLEVQIFVTPAKATAMEDKVKAVKSDSSVLNKKITEAAKLTNTLAAVVSEPTRSVNQTPPSAPTETKNDEPTSICRMQQIFVGKSENDGCADRKGNEFMGSPCSDQTDPTLCLKHGQSKDGSECCYVETKPFCQMKVEFVDMNQNGGCADRKATTSMGSPCSDQTNPTLCLKHGQSTSGSECCVWIGDTTVVTAPSPSLKEIKTTPSSADEDTFIFDEDSLNVGLVIGLSSSIGVATLLLLLLVLTLV